MDAAALAGLNSFGIFDVEADRLDHFFAVLDAAGWAQPSRCAGWSVQDVLAHLAGAELYNHACLNAGLDGFRGMVRAAGIAGGNREFNEWCVRQRRGLPAAEVLAEMREANAETRQRLTDLGRDAPLLTAAGPYPAGLQAFHCGSDYATHADDVGAMVAAAEEPGRTAWRASVGRFALAEQNSPVKIISSERSILVHLGSVSAELPTADFVAATVGRLPPGYPLDPTLADALCCLA